MELVMSLAFEHTAGRKGATSARRESLDPINLVSKIMKKHPHAGVNEICRRVRDALAGSDAKYQEAFDNYCTRNHYNILYKEEVGGGNGRSSKKKNGRASASAAISSIMEPTAEQVAASAQRKRARFEEFENYNLMRLAANCTLHQLWSVGSKFGRKND